MWWESIPWGAITSIGMAVFSSLFAWVIWSLDRRYSEKFETRKDADSKVTGMTTLFTGLDGRLETVERDLVDIRSQQRADIQLVSTELRHAVDQMRAVAASIEKVTEIQRKMQIEMAERLPRNRS